MILTDKAVFRFDPETRLAMLASVHPGITLDEIVAETGYTHSYVPAEIEQTPLPTPDELRLMRELLDPNARMLPR